MGPAALVENFFEGYLAAPVILASGIGYKLWFRTRWVRVSEIDLVTGRREGAEEIEVLKALDGVERSEWSWWHKVYDYFC
jgi:amino acid transporter